MRHSTRLLKSFLVKYFCGAVALLSLTAMEPLRDASAQAVYTGSRFPYQAFSDLPKTHIELGRGVLEVAFAPGATRLSRDDILVWTKSSAESVVAYYGRLPTRTAGLLFVPVPGRRMRGTTFGYAGAASRILFGGDANAAGLESDWVLVHELVHHGFPSIEGGRNWLHEGVATYVEPIARAQMDLLPVEEVWRQLVVGLPNGQPRNGDKGLDGTPTWGRTYWGGAMFFLIADVEIRRRTGNRMGLQHVLQFTVAEGGNITQEWTVERFNAAGARATGTEVLAELYDCLKDTPRTIDLAALWKDLGVSQVGRQVHFDDNASIAHIRRAITEPYQASARQPQRAVRAPVRNKVSPCRTFPWIQGR